ncbi:MULTISPECIES: circular bacteriocin, circularin A/uberolysin family [Staphylococcus]|uniref:circular bacteriocin, circularin A/uberolysin family n=1 Tax=Staphylococcus TaxID=1279 RepID=UPI0014438133|nr:MULTISPECIES: circular bacteriocin, circularin A/uberolysin family [Staphylococcus]MEB6611074.1 circular bacteriocin, circularin A/uberolysin family [Staphylococcus borealis]NKO60755.1 circular bacteriocin, circularin A/uberolysin family [Staphylococcus aureus]
MSISKKFLSYGAVLLIASILVAALGTFTAEITSASSGVSVEFANLATKLGIGQSTAGYIISLINNGSTIWSIASLVAGVSGAGLLAAGGIQGIKYAIKKKGADAAAAW